MCEELYIKRLPHKRQVLEVLDTYSLCFNYHINFTARVMYATVQVLSAEASPEPLLSSMLEAPAARFLWIAGGVNSLEVAFNQLFADIVGARGALWVAPEAVHIGRLVATPTNMNGA